MFLKRTTLRLILSSEYAIVNLRYTIDSENITAHVRKLEYGQFSARRQMADR